MADWTYSPSEPMNALDNPLCAKMGTGWSAYLEGGGNLLGWKVSSARLRSLVDGTVYFTVNDPGVGNLKPPGQPYPLPDLPAHVDHAQLEISYVIYYWGAWGPVYYLTPIYSSEVFVVLDAPKAPMDPAWVSVLRYSCVWAREAVTPARAAELLTKELWIRGTYITVAAVEQLQGCTRNHTDEGEDFHLKMFLGSYGWLPLRGQCNDLADFLVCLVTSVGAYPLRSQRSYPLGTAYSGEPNGNGWRIYTQQIDPAGAPPLTSLGVSHHQFAVYNNMIWDSSYGFVSSAGGIEIAVSWQRDNRYKQALVRYYIDFLDGQQAGSPVLPGSPDEPWNPMPAAGFIPNVITTEPMSGR
ncbi:MAG: hypothetical protein KatS3mg022_0070 [Armatimonadota bacterium]|nr:MAG: hypothetical protein KatS3mg022_0070 [Armatimonadota bacterium]